MHRVDHIQHFFFRKKVYIFTEISTKSLNIKKVIELSRYAFKMHIVKNVTREKSGEIYIC